MNTLALSPRLSTTSDSLKLSDGRSVRWFVEALQLFRRFDETASKDILRSARTLLQQCVDAYPQDLLPSFYLAIADSILGDMNQDAAIAIFEQFSHSAVFEVRAAAEYNLAAAYIEQYIVKRFPDAAAILDKLIIDLTTLGAPIGISSWRKWLYDKLSSRHTRVEQLYYQAIETRCYLRAHLDVWEPRWKIPAPAELEAKAKAALRDLTVREKMMTKHRRFLGDQEAEIWAWHWNNVGVIEEGLAAHARRAGAEASKVDALAGKAEAAYQRALEADPRFSSAKANLGRLYFEIMGKLDEAAEILTEALTGSEDIDYSYYNLGLVRTLQSNESEAVAAFLKAPEMLKRRGQVATWIGARKILIKELEKWGRSAEALALLRQLAAEDPEDDDVRRHVAELEAKLATP